MQEHRAAFFDCLFLGASLRLKRRSRGSFSSDLPARQSRTDSERDRVTEEVLRSVSAWNREYLLIIGPLLERLKYGLNFEAETPRVPTSTAELHRDLLKVTNQMSGYLREIKARVYLIQQDIHEFHEPPAVDSPVTERTPEDLVALQKAVGEQTQHIGENLRLASKLYEELKREAENTTGKSSRPPSVAVDTTCESPTSATPETRQEPGVYGANDSAGEEEEQQQQDEKQVKDAETFEAMPDHDEEDDDDDCEFFRRRKKKVLGLSREERIEVRRQEEEAAKLQRRALDSNLEVLSELKNVFRQGKASE